MLTDISPLMAALRDAAGDSDEGQALSHLPNTHALLLLSREAASAQRPAAEGQAAVQGQRDKVGAILTALRTSIAQAQPHQEAAVAYVEGICRLCEVLDQALAELGQAILAQDADRVEALSPSVIEATEALYERHMRHQRAESDMVLVPQLYAQFQAATHEMLRGAFDRAEWKRLRDAIEQGMRVRKARLLTLSESAGDDEDVHTLLGQAAEGMDESLRGLELMGRWLKSGDLADLNSGWSVLVAATVELQKTGHALGAAQGGHQEDRIIFEGED